MPLSRIARTAALLLGTSLLHPPAALADDAPGGTFSFKVENDLIANTDGHYTHGTRIGWIADTPQQGPAFIRSALAFLFPFDDISGGRIGFALGQNIYTAADTSTKALVPDDRPYAGWLYVGASLNTEKPRAPSGTFSSMTSVELDLGIVGPQAYAEDIQNGYHKLIGIGEAEGWRNQLKNEPAVLLTASRTWRSAPLALGPFAADVLPELDAGLGNVATYAGAGVMVRFGQGLDVDYGPSRNPPFYSPPEIADPDRDFAWYAFVGANGRAVAHNIFLDGNTFVDSHSVDRKWLAGDLRFGVAMMAHGVKLELAETIRAREFTEQGDADRFATLTLSARF